MIRLLLALVRPLHTIASELRIIRTLYEEELSTRERPIVRVTEKPDRRDTEVSYAGMSDSMPPHKRWNAILDNEDDW